jgi:hypothetical protein
MKRFSVRIELHGAESKDYAQLHDAMKARGFTRTFPIQLDNGRSVTKELLRGEYDYIGNVNLIDDVMDLAIEAVQITLRDNLPHIQQLNAEPSIVVSEVLERLVRGLKSSVRTFSFPSK